MRLRLCAVEIKQWTKRGWKAPQSCRVGDRVLWFCHCERLLSHYVILSFINIKILIRGALKIVKDFRVTKWKDYSGVFTIALCKIPSSFVQDIYVSCRPQQLCSATHCVDKWATVTVVWHHSLWPWPIKYIFIQMKVKIRVLNTKNKTHLYNLLFVHLYARVSE